MKKLLIKLFRRIMCVFRGHSHPMFNCFHCGANSPLQFKYDKYGEVLRDSKGDPIMEWRGWRW